MFLMNGSLLLWHGSGFRVLEHKFPSVGKRYALSWSVLSLLVFKCVCPLPGSFYFRRRLFT